MLNYFDRISAFSIFFIYFLLCVHECKSLVFVTMKMIPSRILFLSFNQLKINLTKKNYVFKFSQTQ